MTILAKEQDNIKFVWDTSQSQMSVYDKYDRFLGTVDLPNPMKRADYDKYNFEQMIDNFWVTFDRKNLPR